MALQLYYIKIGSTIQTKCKTLSKVLNMSFKEPCQAHLDLYYALFKEGFTDDQIFERMNKKYLTTKEDFEEWAPFFFNYTKRSIRNDAGKGIVAIELTPALEEKFLEYLRYGLPLDKAAKALNIPLATVTEYWFTFENFKARVDHAIEMANLEVVKALHKRACGFRVHTKTVTTVTGNKKQDDDHADPNAVMQTETIREEIILPSVEAAKFWLINKSPEKWSANGDNKSEGNKGKILEAIDEMTTLTDKDREELAL